MSSSSAGSSHLERVSSLFHIARSHHPKKQMKKLNWVKVPQKVATRSGTLWEKSSTGDDQPKIAISVEELEELFSRKEVIHQKSQLLTNKIDDSAKSTTVKILDQRISLNVSIFLKQFKTSNENIVAIINGGDHTKISIDQLKALQKLLPDKATVSKVTTVYNSSILVMITD